MRKVKWNLLITLTALSNQLNAQNQNKSYIYMIYSSDNNSSKSAIETGFICRSYNGIITALHGVIGKTKIYAINETGNVINNLHIGKVDIRNDVALLTSNELIQDNNAIDVESNSNLHSGQKLKVIGHPVGIKLNEKTVNVGTPAYEQLNSLIPSQSAHYFVTRRSPHEQAQIIYIEGNLVPGQSGAPLMDNGKVLGIIDGGILGGAAGISWAIPLRNLHFVEPSSNTAELNRISSLKASDLFEFELANNPDPSNSKLIYNISSKDIPYALGDFDDNSKLYKIKFADVQGCALENPYRCTYQPICMLNSGDYVFEITYRSEVNGQIPIYPPGAIGIDMDKLELSVCTYDSGGTNFKFLGRKLIAYDNLDYLNGKFKTSRFNFNIDHDDKLVATSAFSFAKYLVLYIKSIKIYSK